MLRWLWWFFLGRVADSLHKHASHHSRCLLLDMSSSSSCVQHCSEEDSSVRCFFLLSSSDAAIHFPVCLCLCSRKVFCSSARGCETNARVKSSWQVKWTQCALTNMDTSRNVKGFWVFFLFVFRSSLSRNFCSEAGLLCDFWVIVELIHLISESMRTEIPE